MRIMSTINFSFQYPAMPIALFVVLLLILVAVFVVFVFKCGKRGQSERTQASYKTWTKILIITVVLVFLASIATFVFVSNQRETSLNNAVDSIEDFYNVALSDAQRSQISNALKPEAPHDGESSEALGVVAFEGEAPQAARFSIYEYTMNGSTVSIEFDLSRE